MSIPAAGAGRVGFILDPETWLGGLNYFRNLMLALAASEDSSLLPVIVTGTRNTAAFESFPPLQVIRDRMMDRGTAAWWFRKILVKICGGDWLLHRLLRRHAVVMISHSAPLTGIFTIPCVGWIPDFQHVHLPQLFTARELSLRDAQYARMCERCEKVIVSSRNALEDLRRFSPAHADKGAVLHFVASPLQDGIAASPAELKLRYELKQRFFLVPNQFWVHKNHKVVIDALQILKSRNQRALVLATGSTRDHRQPQFFESLMEYARACDVAESFRVLGIIPFADLAGLMRDATALINPSLFEGWSTSVEEAKSLGKRILLSDIPVHREQDASLGSYFKSDDAAALAELMTDCIVNYDERTDIHARASAQSEFRGRQREFADEYLEIMMPLLIARRAS